MKRKIRKAAVLLAGMALLTGCEMIDAIEMSSWEPQEADAVSIGRDGGVTEIVHETLEAAYYDATELENMIHSEVDAYNAGYGEESVLVDRFEAEDGSVELVMKYASPEDYARFNNTEFFFGSVIDAEMAGYLFDASYVRVEDGAAAGSPVSGTEVIRAMDKQVLILRAPMEVRLPGDVVYASTNAKILDSNLVDATGEQFDESPGLLLPSNAVYKEESSFAERTAANRVYILYDDI